MIFLPSNFKLNPLPLHYQSPTAMPHLHFPRYSIQTSQMNKLQQATPNPNTVSKCIPPNHKPPDCDPQITIHPTPAISRLKIILSTLFPLHATLQITCIQLFGPPPYSLVPRSPMISYPFQLHRFQRQFPPFCPKIFGFKWENNIKFRIFRQLSNRDERRLKTTIDRRRERMRVMKEDEEESDEIQV